MMTEASLPPIRYLPYRQLRNIYNQASGIIRRYLPYRQLRNFVKAATVCCISYLPYRQLRKHTQFHIFVEDSYLPYRQFRNVRDQWQLYSFFVICRIGRLYTS